MKHDAQYAVILESLAEFNARLRVLDEAVARLEAAAERQLELLERLATRQEQVAMNPTGSNAQPVQASGNRSQAIYNELDDGGQVKRFSVGHTAYARETHPALFKAIDLLVQEECTQNLSVRQLAQQTGVSKSWCAVAKRYVFSVKAVHLLFSGQT